jgi:hypothetical protein
VNLPDVPAKGDVSDWLDAGHTVTELKDLIQQTPDWNPGADVEEQEEAPVPERTMRQLLDDPNLVGGREAVVPHLVWRGRVTLMAAREKVGKSTLASAGCATVSRGLQFLREESAKGCVVWVALEEHLSDLVERLEDFDADPDSVYIVDNLGRDPLKTLTDVIKRRKPAFIVIDTLAALVDLLGVRPDPGNATAWTGIMRKITKIARDTNVGILLLHHGNKTTGDYRDSSAIGANVDMILSLHEKDGLRTLKGKGRWREPERAIRLSDAKWDVGLTDEVLVDPARFDLVSGEMSLEARVIEYVRANEGSSSNDIAKTIKGRRKTILALLKLLSDKGKLVKLSREGGGAAYFSGNHFQTPQDDTQDQREPASGLDGTAVPDEREPDHNGAPDLGSQPESYGSSDVEPAPAEDPKQMNLPPDDDSQKHLNLPEPERPEDEEEEP